MRLYLDHLPPTPWLLSGDTIASWQRQRRYPFAKLGNKAFSAEAKAELANLFLAAPQLFEAVRALLPLLPNSKSREVKFAYEALLKALGITHTRSTNGKTKIQSIVFGQPLHKDQIIDLIAAANSIEAIEGGWILATAKDHEIEVAKRCVTTASSGLYWSSDTSQPDGVATQVTNYETGMQMSEESLGHCIHPAFAPIYVRLVPFSQSTSV